jgi:hypothetical protein
MKKYISEKQEGIADALATLYILQSSWFDMLVGSQINIFGPYSCPKSEHC